MRKIILFVLIWIEVAAYAACVATPALAARQALEPSAGLLTESSGKGFRAMDMIADPLTQRAWVRVLACDHPERPSVLVPVQLSLASISSSATASSERNARDRTSTIRPVAVRAGEPVRLLWNAANIHMEMSAIAESSGAVGDRVSAHLASGLAETPGGVRHVMATISAPGEAVLQP